MNFTDMKCGEFIDELWSKEPVPGGGGSSALVGAVGAALGGMVANLTAGKKTYAQYEEDVQRILTETKLLQEKLLAFIDADAASFEPLSRAYGIPKDDPKRAEIMEKALEEASKVPLDIMECCLEVVKLHAELAEKGSKLAISDVGAGALCCKAALVAASLNVYINAASMKNKSLAQEITDRCDVMIAEGSAAADAVFAKVMLKISPESIQEPRVLYGKPVAEKIFADVIARTEKLKEEMGITPTLAIVRVGGNPDDIWYERGAVKQCEKCGMDARSIVFPETVSEEELIACINALNTDASVDGVIIMCPLPKHVNEKKVRETLAPEKDVDGITSSSQAGVFAGNQTGFAPCTAQACMETLDFYGINPKGKTAAVIGRSLIIGKPVSMLLMQRDATVTICHSKTEKAWEKAKNSDIVVAAIGSAGAIDKKYFSKGQVVLDVGINSDENGKIVGDINFEDAKVAGASATPTPGGIGSVTTSILLSHVVSAAEAGLK